MKILVTGGTSTVGKHLKKILPHAIYVSSKDADLTDYSSAINLFSKHKPDFFIHLSARVGGIMDNISKPVDFYEENILINLNTIKSAFKSGCYKGISLLSSCIYPNELPIESYPLSEDYLHNGIPPEPNFSYAYAKRCLDVHRIAYNKQYGTSYSSLIPCNLYSEFDCIEGNKAHYVPALINKIKLAKSNKESSINLFGTARPYRQFMYTGDLAKAIKALTLSYSEPFIYNIATPENKTIAEIAAIALDACDAQNIKINWDHSKPDGQFRKDISSKDFLNKHDAFEFTKLKDGIRIVFDKIK